MSHSHSHDPNSASLETGNTLGTKSCVRQSKLFRMYESGNDMKNMLGMGNLVWKTNEKEGAYKGQKVYDHNAVIHTINGGYIGGGGDRGKVVADTKSLPN